MNCRNCGARVEPDDLVCGNCGHVIDSAPQLAPKNSMTLPKPIKPRRPLSPTGILIIIFSCGMFTLIAASILGGVATGLQDRETDRQAKADQYYHAGVTHFATGQLQLAEVDFLYVLKLDPNYPGASGQLSQVQTRLTVVPTPTAAVSQTKVIDQLFQTGQSAYQTKNWARAIDVLSQVRAIDPKYQTDKVNSLLYQAALTYGLELLKTDRLEEGVAYLDQAAYIQPLPNDSALNSQYAKMYLTARGYWNVDWQKAIDRFSELYAIGPGYKDTFTRLVEAHINYGDQLSQSLDFCTARQNYEAANQLRPDPNLQPKIVDTQQKCLTATPSISGTLTAGNVDGTPGASQTLSGLFTGRLAFPMSDASGSRIFAASAGSPSIYIAAVGDQPELQRNGSNMVYRLTGVGINLVNLAIGSIETIAPPGASSPTFSPDGTRVIYSLHGRLYVVGAHGGAPVDLGAGTTPVWGPTDLLAFSGCDGSGCGIMLRNPDQSNPPTRLTGSPQDIPTSWSPDGANISYFSNVTGAYNLFFVNTFGGVQQVTIGSSNSIAGAWGPDGAHIAFLSDRDGAWSVYIARFDGTEAQKIINAPQSSDWINARLSWMP
ncbi:MAG TPA: hypothetical protein VFF70_14635 [Anaerolineae bacterium]|nr:hypothetical protein [Anaerolineae bacterium]